MHETPAIESHIIASNKMPGGMGELGTAALMPALANALHALEQRESGRPKGTTTH